MILIEGTDHILKYDTKDEEYWLESPEDQYWAPKTSSNADTTSVDTDSSSTFLFGIDEDDNSIPQIKRIKGDTLENVNGFRARKWTTTFSGSKHKTVIEEWLVDELPLLDISDSLKNDIIGKFNPYKDKKDLIKFKFSSDNLIEEADSNSTIQPLEGRIVRAKAVMNEGFMKSMSFEIRELYAMPFDASSFSIPKEYEQIKNE